MEGALERILQELFIFSCVYNGNYSNYKVTQEETENIVMENAKRGKEIEDNLETKLLIKVNFLNSSSVLV